MKFNPKYLPKADVVFTVMFLNKALCEKTLNIILGETIELKQIAVESKSDLHKAALNSIYFDVKTQAKDGRIFTLDLQRRYIKDRVRKRTIYYACHEIASQKISESKYENLKNVVVSFLLTEAPLKLTSDNKKIQLYDNYSGELYSDLLTIHEVNIRHISGQNSEELQILKAFFEIDSEESYLQFVFQFGNSDYGKLLLTNYETAVSEPSLLDKLSEEEKFMIKLSDEERLKERMEGREEGRMEGRQEGRQEGRIQVARSMLKKGFSMNDISEITGLSSTEIEQL